MTDKLLSMVERYDMVRSGDMVHCALSGGADSVALLLGLYLLREKLDITLCAAHFNHHLRGEESLRDENFVRALCLRLDIPLTVGEGKIQPGKKGLEAAARDARYAFFATLPGKTATAHTADDNAETILMRMVRGTGLKGLGGICPVRGRLIRPMLGVTRREVLAFLREYHMDYVEDSSNGSDAFLRNRLRHGVMPLLAAENPRLAENLSAMALRLREDEEALSPAGELPRVLSVSQTLALPKARRSRVLAAFLEARGVKEPEAEHIALAESLLVSENPSARGSFPGGVTLRREYGLMTAEMPEEGGFCRELRCPGVTEVWEAGLRVCCTQAEWPDGDKSCFYVRPEGKLFLRSRRPGDEICLPGGTKPLKKLFIDRKIPAARRQSVPVISDDRGVLGVYGIGGDIRRTAADGPCIKISFTALSK